MTEQEIEEGLRKALERGGGHTLEDVARLIRDGQAQLWAEDEAVLVTQIIDTPQRRELHFWLATGALDKVVDLSNRVLDWGRDNGCEHATLSGRRGWVKALSGEGWTEELVLMGRPIG